MSQRTADFIARLHVAAHWEAYVAAAFTRAGYHVLLGPTSVADNPRMFAQAIDLLVCSCRFGEDAPPLDSGSWQAVEVKGTQPRVTDGLVLVCSEYTFNNKTEEDRLYAHYVFCSPKSGKMFGLLEGTPIVRGHQQTDQSRGTQYNVIKAESRYLIPFENLCKAIGSRTYR